MNQRKRGRESREPQISQRNLGEESQTESKLLLTVPEVAQRLSLGRSFVYQLVMKGEIRSIKVGRARRIPVTALEQFIATRMEEDFDSNFDSNLDNY